MKKNDFFRKSFKLDFYVRQRTRCLAEPRKDPKTFRPNINKPRVVTRHSDWTHLPVLFEPGTETPCLHRAADDLSLFRIQLGTLLHPPGPVLAAAADAASPKPTQPLRISVCSVYSLGKSGTASGKNPTA